MKRLLFLLTLAVCSLVSMAQVTTEPAIISDGYTGEIKVIYDPSGSGMATATECYAHTGIITSSSTEWQCTPEWRDNANPLTQEGDNWVMTIDNMYDFYDCASGTFEKMMFVFNDGTGGSNEGKTADGGDIAIEIFAAGLNVAFDTNAPSGMVEAGESLSFTANATTSSDMSISLDGTVLVSETGVTSITYTGTAPTTAGDYVYEVNATTTAQSASDSRSIAVVGATQTAARPSGIDEGIYYGTDGTSATLSLYAANKSGTPANSVFVIGDFNDWNISNAYQLKRDDNYFWIELTGLTAGEEYAYQYVVTRSDDVVKQISDPYATMVLHPDDKWEPKQMDPSLKDYPTDDGDGYVAVLRPGKTEFNWSSATLNFDRPSKTNLIIYEAWIYDFSPARSYAGMTTRLDYLENLGINALELMPITEFEGNMSWGYNPTHYFAPDRAYGSEEDLKILIDECHKRGIAVILDMVFNHATGQNPQNKLYPYGTDLASNPWFNTEAPHSSSVFEDWNHDFENTQKMFKSSLTFWAEEYKVDGYRMDLSGGFCGPNCDNRVAIMFNYYNAAKTGGGDDTYFILEHWEGTDEWSNYVNNGMMCWANNTNSYCQTAMGWLHDGDGLDASNIDGYVSYCESHDEERCFYKAKEYGNGTVGTSETDRLARVPMNVAFNVMLNGPHMLWQFEELGYDYSICSDYQGVVGTDCDRTSTKPIPESKGWLSDANRMGAYQKLGQIMQLRSRIAPSVFEGDPTSSDLGSGSSLRSVIWGTGDDRIFMVGNFNVSGGSSYTGSETLSLPSGNSWFDYLASGSSSIAAGTSINLEPGEIKIYTAQQFDLPDVPTEYNYSTGITEEQLEDSKCIVYPSIASDLITIQTEENIVKVQMMGISGKTYSMQLQNDQINIANLEKGMYLLIITLDNGQEAYKILKK